MSNTFAKGAIVDGESGRLRFGWTFITSERLFPGWYRLYHAEGAFTPGAIFALDVLPGHYATLGERRPTSVDIRVFDLKGTPADPRWVKLGAVEWEAA